MGEDYGGDWGSDYGGDYSGDNFSGYDWDYDTDFTTGEMPDNFPSDWDSSITDANLNSDDDWGDFPMMGDFSKDGLDIDESLLPDQTDEGLEDVTNDTNLKGSPAETEAEEMRNLETIPPDTDETETDFEEIEAEFDALNEVGLADDEEDFSIEEEIAAFGSDLDEIGVSDEEIEGGLAFPQMDTRFEQAEEDLSDGPDDIESCSDYNNSQPHTPELANEDYQDDVDVLTGVVDNNTVEDDSEELEEIETQNPINSKYANDIFTFDSEEEPELSENYPEGVRFDADGYPDFSPYAIEEVEIDMKGNYTTDYDDANKAAGLAQKPEGYTWHHHQDGKTMLLVPTDLHSAVKHTGGVSVIKHQSE